MKILYIGDAFEHSTSTHRANALRRLGHEITHINPRATLPNWRIVGGLSVRLGYGIFAPFINQVVKKALTRQTFDLAWIDAGSELGPAVYHLLRRSSLRIINYNVDDPFSSRDGRKWNLYRKSVSLQDLTVVVREENVAEAKAAGARRVLRVYRSFDPVAHSPVELTAGDWIKWSSKVSFIGTWMPERGPFMASLIKQGVPLSIWGDWWQKAPEWPVIQKVWRGYGIYGRDFVAATQCSKVALGLLSKGNRDLHTTRSAEVPYIAGPVFCAERTREHSYMYQENEEAVFWENVDECATQCFRLVGDETLQRRIVVNGRRRVEAWQLSNDAIIQDILKVNSGGVSQHTLVFA